MTNPIEPLNTPAISARGILKAAGISHAKYYDVKRGKSSFSHEETDLILEQLHILKNFPIIPREEFWEFLRSDKRIVLKYVLPGLSKNEYERFRKDLKNGSTITNKRHAQIAISFAKWQATLPDVKERLIKNEIELSIHGKDYEAFIKTNFSEREVQFYRIDPDDI